MQCVETDYFIMYFCFAGLTLYSGANIFVGHIVQYSGLILGHTLF